MLGQTPKTYFIDFLGIFNFFNLFFPNLLLSPYHFSLSYSYIYFIYLLSSFSCLPYDKFLLPLSKNVFTAQATLPFQTPTLPTKHSLFLSHTHENINFATEQKWNYIKICNRTKMKVP